MLLAVGILVILISCVAAAWFVLPGFRAPRTDLVTHEVKRERLLLTIVERGSLESANNNDIYCRVKARSPSSTVSTTIRWIIDNGTHVKPGQLLVELDDSGLQETRKTQEITVNQAESAWKTALEDVRIQEIQNEAAIKKALLDENLAVIDLEKYLEADYERDRKLIQNTRLTALSDLDMLRDRAAWAERMAKKGYYSPTQVLAEQSRLEAGDINLKKIDEDLRVLEYTRKRSITDFQNKIELAQLAVKQARTEADANREKKQADALAKEKVYLKEAARLDELEDEISKCQIYSPQEGMVVYYQSEQSRFGSGSQQSTIAQGEPVREGQKMMSIPDLTNMVVNAKVNEALVSRVKGESYIRTGFSDMLRAGMGLSINDPLSALARLSRRAMLIDADDEYKDKEQQIVYGGQRAMVRVEAFPSKILKAHVKNVATVNSQQDWSSADVKVYQTLVSIDEPLEGVKPGMSAEVTIINDKQLDDVLAIPVQAVIGSPSMGPKRKCYVLTPGANEPVEREIVLGMSNEKMVEIQNGLEDGELVVLNARSLFPDKTKGSLGSDQMDPGPAPKNQGGPGGGKGGGNWQGGPGGGGPGGAAPGAGAPGGGGPRGGAPGAGRPAGGQ